MALELLVDEAEYRKALGKYNTELGKLKGYRDDLQKEINKMTGATYSGTGVQDSIDKAKESLNAVNKAILRVEKLRDSIEMQLDKSQSTRGTLDDKMGDIKIPNLFK